MARVVYVSGVFWVKGECTRGEEVWLGYSVCEWCVLGEGGVYQGRGMPIQVWLVYSVCAWCVLGEGGVVLFITCIVI